MPHSDTREVTVTDIHNKDTVYAATDFFFGPAGQFNILTEDNVSGVGTLTILSQTFWQKITHRFIRSE